MQISSNFMKGFVLLVYSVKVAPGWNSLPRDVVNAKSLNSFRKKLDDYCGDRKYSCDPVFV